MNKLFYSVLLLIALTGSALAQNGVETPVVRYASLPPSCTVGKSSLIVVAVNGVDVDYTCGSSGHYVAIASTANNLSDLNNLSAARTNLGVGPAFQSSTWVAFGDSITAGWEANGTANSTCANCTYEVLGGAALNATVTNNGDSSRSACDLDDQSIFLNTTLATTDLNQIFTLMVGTNDVVQHYTTWNTDGYGAMFQACHQAAVAWISTTNKYAANSTNCTDTGTWAAWLSSGNGSSPLVGEFSITPGSTKTCSITTTGGPIYVWSYVVKGSTGTASYSVDSGAETGTWAAAGVAGGPVSQVGDTNGWQLIRIPVAAGNHTVTFTVTTASTNNGIVIEALGTSVPATQQGPKAFIAGIPRQQGDGNSAASAYYDGLVKADVLLLSGDGLPVTFVPIRNYLCTSVVSGVCYNSYGVADMNTTAVDPPGPSGYGVHPNQQGHTDMKQAFLETMQITPYPPSGSAGTGTVSNGSSGQFAYYAANGTTVSGHTLVAGDIPSLNYQTPLSFTGNGSKTASATAAGTSGNCVKWDANGNVVDAGAPCGTSSTPPTVVQTNQSNTYTTGTQDASAATHTLPAVVGLTSAKPATCKTGELYFATDATAGQNIYACSATNTWTQQAAGGSGGSVTDSQLPSDQCVLTKYSLSYSSLTAAASATPTLTFISNLGSANVRICVLEIKPVTSFTGSGITAATVRVQSGNGVYYSPTQDVFSTPTPNNYWTDAGSMADLVAVSSAYPVVAAFSFTGATSSALTAGSLNITIGTRIMP